MSKDNVPWENEPHFQTGEVDGFKFVMKRNPLGVWCGYVGLTRDQLGKLRKILEPNLKSRYDEMFHKYEITNHKSEDPSHYQKNIGALLNDYHVFSWLKVHNGVTFCQTDPVLDDIYTHDYEYNVKTHSFFGKENMESELQDYLNTSFKVENKHFWIGFHCMGKNDYKPIWYVAKSDNDIKEYKNMEFVEKEVKNMIKQINVKMVGR